MTPIPHILIADDNPDTLDALRDLCAGSGYRCTVVPSGAAAYRVFTADPPALLITDLNMAGGDGYVLINRVRRVGPVPIVAITGCNTAYARGRLENDHPNVEILTKPFARQRLLDVVANLLSGTLPSRGKLAEQIVGRR